MYFFTQVYKWVQTNLILFSEMIFNKVYHHELEFSGRFLWSVVRCSRAGSHGSSQLRFSLFEFVFQVAAGSLSSSPCGFLSLNEFVWCLLKHVWPRSPASPSLFLFLPLIQSVLTGAWNGGSWLSCQDLPAMGAVYFYVRAAWPLWKPLDMPGTRLPFKHGSGLDARGGNTAID